ERGVEIHRRPGQALGSCPTYAPDRDEHRQGSAIYPLQRHGDRRPGWPGALYGGATVPDQLTPGRRALLSPRAVRRPKETASRSIALFYAIPGGKPSHTFPGIAF